MEREPASYLLILGDREPLAWVLREERMAFPRGRVGDARELRAGDSLLIYTTRGCFRSPTRDRGRVIGKATVESDVEQLDDPVVFADREFTSGCSLAIEGLSPLHKGVELAPLVSQLSVFPDPASWSAYMRRPLLALSVKDSRFIERKLRPLLRTPADVVAEYVSAAKTVR